MFEGFHSEQHRLSSPWRRARCTRDGAGTAAGNAHAINSFSYRYVPVLYPTNEVHDGRRRCVRMGSWIVVFRFGDLVRSDVLGLTADFAATGGRPLLVRLLPWCCLLYGTLPQHDSALVFHIGSGPQ